MVIALIFLIAFIGVKRLDREIGNLVCEQFLWGILSNETGTESTFLRNHFGN